MVHVLDTRYIYDAAASRCRCDGPRPDTQRGRAGVGSGANCYRIACSLTAVSSFRALITQWGRARAGSGATSTARCQAVDERPDRPHINRTQTLRVTECLHAGLGCVSGRVGSGLTRSGELEGCGEKGQGKDGEGRRRGRKE